MTVWEFAYNDGSAKTVSFDRTECERRTTRKNCAMDVQRYQNGLVRVYNGPDVWNSYVLIFRHIGQATIAKVAQLAAVRVPVKFYYRKHRDNNYSWVNVVPTKARKYVAGGLSVDSVRLDLVETNSA